VRPKASREALTAPDTPDPLALLPPRRQRALLLLSEMVRTAMLIGLNWRVKSMGILPYRRY